MPITLRVDARQIEVWEILIFEESGRRSLEDVLYVLSFYVVDDNGDRVSPELTKSPPDMLSPAEIKAWRASQAYQTLRRLPVAELRAAAESFGNQSRDGFVDNPK